MTQTTDIDIYWNRNHILGEAVVRRYAGTSLIGLKMHRSEERIFHHKEHLFPISLQQGTRSYFHAMPYILIPKVTMTVARGRRAKRDTAAIGKVVDSEAQDLQEVEIGQAQAWYYQQDHSLVLWGCFLKTRFRSPDLASDSLHELVWTGFEEQLMQELPDIHRIYTTFEPRYTRLVWTQFLTKQGYQKIDTAAFIKAV